MSTSKRRLVDHPQPATIWLLTGNFRRDIAVGKAGGRERDTAIPQ
jgi:hypothetical protein